MYGRLSAGAKSNSVPVDCLRETVQTVCREVPVDVLDKFNPKAAGHFEAGEGTDGLEKKLHYVNFSSYTFPKSI